MKFKGRAWTFGDDVDTDVIIPAKHLNTSDPKELAAHAMEGAGDEFAKGVKQGDLIIAGKNFGCGSSREHAPIAIKAAGVSAVVAGSYARIFYRNAFNIGLPIFESPGIMDAVKKGDEIEIDADRGVIKNLSTGNEFQAKPIPPFMQDLIKKGGLVEWTKEKIKA
jgi:3-isopropylmalate/(R)-2-methylmalate dehydratase small subunit